MAMLMVGGCHVVMPKFEAKSALGTIKQDHVTSLITVPAMLADKISLNRMRKTWKGLVTVKKILNGGGSLSVELLKDAHKVFPTAKILSAYRRILLRGPQMMLGYWDQTKSKELGAGDGSWFDTGDIGRLDDGGNVWLIGRTKGQIKSGGENVYPEEVEAILLKHPGVSCAVVVGLPDTCFTEMVVACIQIKDNWKWADYSSDYSAKEQCLSSEILQNFCKEKNLTGFKIPNDFVIWRKPLPLTMTGKLRREN